MASARPAATAAPPPPRASSSWCRARLATAICMALTSRAFLDGEAGAEPALSMGDPAAANEGPTPRGGAGGPIGRLIAEGQSEAAAAMLATLNEVPGRLYTTHAPRPPRGSPQRSGARRSPMPMTCRSLLTNDAYFPDRDFYEAHDALCALPRAAPSPDVSAPPADLTQEHFFRWAADARPIRRSAGSLRHNTLRPLRGAAPSRGGATLWAFSSPRAG